jgi:hypothetical protein
MTSIIFHTVNKVAKTSELVLVLHKLRPFSVPPFYPPSPHAYLMVLNYLFSSLSITVLMMYKAISRKIVRFISTVFIYRWSQWPRVLRHGSTAARLLELRFRTPPMVWMFFLANVVCCQVKVSAPFWSLVQSNPTECGVSECVREASIRRRPWPTRGCCAMKKKSCDL